MAGVNRACAWPDRSHHGAYRPPGTAIARWNRPHARRDHAKGPALERGPGLPGARPPTPRRGTVCAVQLCSVNRSRQPRTSTTAVRDRSPTTRHHPMTISPMPRSHVWTGSPVPAPGGSRTGTRTPSTCRRARPPLPSAPSMCRIRDLPASATSARSESVAGCRSGILPRPPGTAESDGARPCRPRPSAGVADGPRADACRLPGRRLAVNRSRGTRGDATALPTARVGGRVRPGRTRRG